MLEIQRLSINEGERLRQLRLASLEDAPDAFSSTFQEAVTLPRDSWLQQLQVLPTFVAVLKGVDSGMVCSSPHPENAHVAYLISMWVAPNARGQGVGDALLDAVIDWARSSSYTQLLLDVSNDNSFAITLYKRKGFKPTGMTSCLPPPREHIPELEMALDL